MKIAPSILTANFCEMGKTIKMLEESGADWIHLDIMDNAFVPNLSFGQSAVRDINAATALPLDVHLMVNDPNPYIEEFIKAGADILTVHAESPGCVHLARTLSRIRDAGAKAGVCLNPATSHEALEYIYENVDLILLMSVNPGFGGQKFIPQTLRKIECVAKRVAELGLDIEIEVDGGINPQNARDIVSAGATVLVAGSAVINSPDPCMAIREMRGKI